jgi:hypothetical protein
MSIIAALALLTAVATSSRVHVTNHDLTTQPLNCDSLGSFDTFTDDSCSQGGQGITVDDNNASGELNSDVLSIKAYIPTCAGKYFSIEESIIPMLGKWKRPSKLISSFLVIVWVNGGNWYPLVIPPNNNNCVQLSGSGRKWNLSCP